MGSIKMLTPNSSNTPLNPINISNIQIDPSINSRNLVVKNIMHITLDSHVHPNMTINVSAPKVMHPNLLSLEVARPSKSLKHDFDFDHSPINKYLWHLRCLKLCGVKISYWDNVHESSLTTYLRLIHIMSYSKEDVS
jgi:hypothetical protein